MTTRKLSRRQFLAGGGTSATAALVLVACPPSCCPADRSDGAAPAMEGAAVTLTAFGEADKTAFAAVADAYMEQNPDVTVETTSCPTTKVTTQRCKRNMPAAAIRIWHRCRAGPTSSLRITK
ncbi:MAG: twin-arginine translocation signal domain-containing protein [Caldilineaceae bacterium]